MKITKSTLTRTIVLLIALMNQVITIMGLNPLPFSNEGIYEGISTLITVLASLWSWWKNNSFTQSAIKADEYKNKLKAGEIDD